VALLAVLQLKIELELSDGQVAVLEKMGDIYGPTVQDRARHILTDLFVAKNKELSQLWTSSTWTLPASQTLTVR
jgi:hypothetical protein